MLKIVSNMTSFVFHQQKTLHLYHWRQATICSSLTKISIDYSYSMSRPFDTYITISVGLPGGPESVCLVLDWWLQHSNILLRQTNGRKSYFVQSTRKWYSWPVFNKIYLKYFLYVQVSTKKSTIFIKNWMTSTGQFQWENSFYLP